MSSKALRKTDDPDLETLLDIIAAIRRVVLVLRKASTKISAHVTLLSSETNVTHACPRPAPKKYN